jgi:3-dehydroquinate dehydratase-1
MGASAQIAFSLSHPAVVGTVHSSASLQAAARAGKRECDWLELRVDNFFPQTRPLLAAARTLRLPRIVTVRHPSEGGAAAALANPARIELYSAFLEIAGLVDVELRHARAMRPLLRNAKAAGAGVILSFHDFQRTPPLARLREMALRARDAGADIFKVATKTAAARDLALLLEFLADEKTALPVAAMGMGQFGKISRLALAKAGSCLNYGYLATPNADGQWPVAILKKRIAEL